MSRHNITPDQIDALLPQTQCRDCGYQGCRPYAEAIIYKNESLDRCLPGGVETLKKIGNLLATDVRGEIPLMAEKAKPKRLAIIREQECIGCTKCIQACPVDAILGASQQMHSIINAECTGCGLCVEPCPMDCIDLIVTEDQNYQREHSKQRYYARQERIAKGNSKNTHKQIAHINNASSLSVDAKKAEIAAAIERAKMRKINRS